MAFVRGRYTNPIDDDRREGFNRTRAKGFAHGQSVNHKVDRNRVEGFARNQPINQNVSGVYSYYQLDSEDESEDNLPEDYYGYLSKKRHSRSGGFYRTDDDFSIFQVEPIIPTFHGYCHPENFIYWFRKVDKFFEFYADIPEEKEVKYAAHKLYGYVSTWWERLQSNRLRQYKQPIRTWPRMRRLISDRFLQSNRGQELYQEYRRKLKSKQMFRDNFDVQYSHVTADTNYSRNMPMSLTQLSFGSQKKNQVPSSSSQSFHNYYDGYEVAEEEGDRVEFSDKDEVGDEEEIGSAEDCLSVPTVEQQFDLDKGATKEVIVREDENISISYQVQELKGEESHELVHIISQHVNTISNIELCEPHGGITCPSDEDNTNALHATSCILDLPTNFKMDQSQEKLQFQNEVQIVDFLGLEQFEFSLNSRTVDIVIQLNCAKKSPWRVFFFLNYFWKTSERLKYSKYLFLWNGRWQISNENSRASSFEEKETDVGQDWRIFVFYFYYFRIRF
ncbi:hypothetical protein RHGRI_028072 [Rhododendron griersonianum]|uniref:Retrotransposon gag domain-containing protein n=2 Tax=Rhododendron griersonianum TaxID=479676 RepID=A0AAV6IED3_9ERIC|nr:hypothetical protein RHGRI_028072 [Rhododendron griersonianum]